MKNCERCLHYIWPLFQEFDDAIASLTLINAIFNTAFIVAGSYSFIIGLNRRRGASNNSSMTIEIMCKLVVAGIKFGFGLIAASVLHTRVSCLSKD